jgi:hypothetical protein
MLTERKIIDIGSDRTVNPTKRAGYAPLVEKGAKTALEVGVRAITIMLENNAGDLYLTMTATGRSRLVEAATNQLLWFDEQIEVQTVSHHRLPDWKAGDDGMVKSEIDEGLDMLAREISHTVFLEGQVD